MTANAASLVIGHAHHCASTLGEELLFWATEIARAEQAGTATDTQLQALQSALALARSQARALRLLLGRKVELTQAQSDAIVTLDGELTDLAQEYDGLLARARVLWRAGTSRPIPSRPSPGP